MKKVVIISTDPIADMLTRIRNGLAVNREQVSLPHSRAKETVARILSDNGFVYGVKTGEEAGRKTLEISLSSDGNTAPITEISRLSKPGRRIYVKAEQIPTIKRGRGVVVVSTSKGVMTGKDAKAQHLGGELICKVY